MLEHRRRQFLISTDRNRLDLEVIYQFLTNSYWAKGIPRAVVAGSIEHSLCFGIYDEGGEESPGLQKDASPFDFARGKHQAPGARGGASAPAQVGFARVVSDFATVAYLGDVFVLESHRGQGLGKWMMECIMAHPALQNLRRWILLTRDAHALYTQSGFTPVAAPERYMELHRPDVYESRKTT